MDTVSGTGKNKKGLRARSGSLGTQGLMCKMRWPWELWHKSRCKWTLSMSRAKVRRDITKVRSEMSSKSAKTTTRSSFLYTFAPRRAFFTTKYHSQCIEKVWIQKSPRIWGTLFWPPGGLVEKSFCTSTEGPWPCAEAFHMYLQDGIPSRFLLLLSMLQVAVAVAVSRGEQQ